VPFAAIVRGIDGSRPAAEAARQAAILASQAGHPSDHAQARVISFDDLDIQTEVDATVAAAATFAGLAASTDGARPWRIAVEDAGIVVRADRRDGLSERRLTIACGTALFNLRAALEHAQLDITVSARPDPGDRDLLARVQVHGLGEGPADDLFEAIALRHTESRPFGARRVAPESVAALQAAAAAEGTWLQDLRDPSALLAVLATAGDGPMAWLAAGQGLERVLLTAAREGLRASVIDACARNPELRYRLAEQLKPPGVPQMVLRLGHPVAFPAHAIEVLALGQAVRPGGAP
jgi:hypothetical protein